jgi:hypothetical protein
MDFDHLEWIRMAKRVAPTVLPPSSFSVLWGGATVFFWEHEKQPWSSQSSHVAPRTARIEIKPLWSMSWSYAERIQTFPMLPTFFPHFAYLQVECEHFGWWKRWVCHVRKRSFPLTYVVEWTRLKHHSTIFHPFTIKAVFFEWKYMDIWKYILNDHRTYY